MTKPPRKPAKPLLIDENLPLQSRKVQKRNPAQPSLPFDPMPDRVADLCASCISPVAALICERTTSFRHMLNG
jgi:bifunctional non-homologous end joining protein LigD